MSQQFGIERSLDDEPTSADFHHANQPPEVGEIQIIDGQQYRVTSVDQGPEPDYAYTVNLEPAGVCPHCEDPWDHHQDRCTDCGCQWTKPKPPPPPPSAHDLLVAKVREAIFDELDHQHEPGDIGGAGYWDREYGCLDGEPNWSRVADAAIAAVNVAEMPKYSHP